MIICENYIKCGYDHTIDIFTDPSYMWAEACFMITQWILR